MLSSHGRQSTPSSAPEVNTPGGLLTIGELARRAGVTASALRYYEELGLLPPPARISGQRRYPESAARLVAAILLYSDAGFTLAEQKALMAPRDGTPGWRQLAQRKLAELDEQIARAQAVREAIRHGLRCPHEDITQCPNFNAGITARLAGQPLSRSHQQLHGRQFHEPPGVARRPPGGLREVGRVAIGNVPETGTIRAACSREPRLLRESQAVTGKA
jgi:DNA-binding transcriptional MerR regulator